MFQRLGALMKAARGSETPSRLRPEPVWAWCNLLFDHQDIRDFFPFEGLVLSGKRLRYSLSISGYPRVLARTTRRPS